MGIAVEPLGEGASLRAGELDLLYARKQVALHTAEGIVLADILPLHLGGVTEIEHQYQHLQDKQHHSGSQERPAVDAHLDEIDHRERTAQQCTDNRLIDLLAQPAEVVQLGGQFAAAVRMEEFRGQQEESSHNCVVEVHLHDVLNADDIQVADIGCQHDGHSRSYQQSGNRSQVGSDTGRYHRFEHHLVCHRHKHTQEHDGQCGKYHVNHAVGACRRPDEGNEFALGQTVQGQCPGEAVSLWLQYVLHLLP